ncbi:lipopolysaccharide biosynthesis protein [Beijerinckia indica]|uniref:Polysaccharide biosynthesis protein n=1 Tax=Beijerinckia indica subsp. indica (strain ATCC 9039 / DSM 1715 / NCIMB 8712) TaxID=395963 RepID=B2IJB3_BEII9|nr:oligosaccharide flippase family protein [Beijerinckia indica]ACB96231.1 polysaccharide biosynthesis protein [Beijerinckia indica subsp. indica ATCC 9039]
MFRSTLLYLPAQLTGPLLQFLSVVIWAQTLSPAEVGVVTLIIALQEILFAALLMWWSHYMLRNIRKFSLNNSRSTFLKTELFAVAVSVFMQIVVSITIIAVYFDKNIIIPSYYIIVAFMISRSMSNYISERARAESMISLYSIMQILSPGLGLFISMVFLKFWQANAAAVLLGFTIAQFVSLAIGFVICDFGRAVPYLDKQILIQALKFGIPVMIASTIALVALNAPRFIVDHLVGIEAAGVFAIGYSLGLRASNFAVMLVTAGAYPLVVKKMVEEGLESAYEQLRKNIILVTIVVCPVAAGLIAINHDLIMLIVGKQFQEATFQVLPFTALAGLFRYLRGHTTDQVFLINSKPIYTTIISVLDLAMALVSAFIGVYLFGLVGGALGPMVSGFTTLIVSFLLCKGFGFRPPVSAMSLACVSAALMALPIYYLPHTVNWLLLAIKVITGAAIYVLLIALLMPSERKTILSLVRGRRFVAAA